MRHVSASRLIGWQLRALEHPAGNSSAILLPLVTALGDESVPPTPRCGHQRIGCVRVHRQLGCRVSSLGKSSSLCEEAAISGRRSSAGAQESEREKASILSGQRQRLQDARPVRRMGDPDDAADSDTDHRMSVASWKSAPTIQENLLRWAEKDAER